MMSIEQAETSRDRIEDNKPFRIPVDYRKSKDALPDLDWSKNQFLWLDYDDPICPDMLLDMQTVVRRARSGTVLAVSVQCTKAPQLAQAEQDNSAGAPKALDRFTAVFGRVSILTKTDINSHRKTDADSSRKTDTDSHLKATTNSPKRTVSVTHGWSAILQFADSSGSRIWTIKCVLGLKVPQDADCATLLLWT